ncbi:MAG TPA: molybdate ABC transporter permease subunit [Syntrophorhabdaceae bacterium]|nr:molybdate ABC transporter permease subunit [Syntrophorhabdaceae bacterium]
MEHPIFFSLRLSFQVAIVSTCFVIIIGICVAYLLARRDFKGKELVDMLFTLPLVLPPTVTGYYLIILFGRNGLIGHPIYQWTGWSIMFTWYGAALASFIVSLPLMVKITRAAFESIDKNLISASYTLGHSELVTALKVILPIAKKGLIAGTVLAFARALGEFGATLMVAGNIPGKTNTMPLTIYSLANSGAWSQANILVIFFTALSGFFLYTANKLSKRIL